MYIPGLQVCSVEKIADESGFSAGQSSAPDEHGWGAGQVPGVDGMSDEIWSSADLAGINHRQSAEYGSSAEFADIHRGQSDAKHPRRRPSALCCDRGSPCFSRTTLPLLPPPSPLPDSPPSLSDIASLRILDEADPVLVQRPSAWELHETSAMLIRRADKLLKSGAGRIRGGWDANFGRLDGAGPILGHGAVQTHGRVMCHGLKAVAV